ncbi:MAG TPA: alanine--glyoxylate aminotransferase family protein [Verrucomicrobiae bacterium]|nr:alanine--glyoxylate aminotransferase family protein [Verrucomicrobiae bacterium]
MTQSHVKLFIPGPVEVSEGTFQAMSQPMIGHRSSGFQELYASIHPKLQQVLYTRNPVFISTSSAWGVMEAAVRNLVAKKVLNCCCGAFSDKWFDVSKRSGKEAEALKVEWGQPILPEMVDAKLKTGHFDVVTLVHNETSTGLMNPLADIAKVMRNYPDVMFIVDTVSSMTAVKIETDALGIDVILAGTQKAWALPPGLAVFAVSARALKRAETISGRGYYFDFLEFKANHDKNMTPSTPSIPHIYGLKYKLEQFEKEGIENRYARHLKMAQMTRAWAKSHGFEMFPKAGYESITLSCIKNNKNIDVAKLQKTMKEKYRVQIDGGYGQIKGKSFRLAHMGDETPETITQLHGMLDDCLKSL